MILNLNGYTFYIRPGITDMRRGYLSLIEIVETEMGKEVDEKSMYLFCSKAKNKIKILVWENGYWLMTKNLEKGTFSWPKEEQEVREIKAEDVRRLLKGEGIFREFREYKKVNY